MGANTTQAAGVSVFLAAFTVLSAGIANGGVLMDLLGLALLVASITLFRKCKPWEDAGE